MLVAVLVADDQSASLALALGAPALRDAIDAVAGAALEINLRRPRREYQIAHNWLIPHAGTTVAHRLRPIIAARSTSGDAKAGCCNSPDFLIVRRRDSFFERRGGGTGLRFLCPECWADFAGARGEPVTRAARNIGAERRNIVRGGLISAVWTQR